MFDWVLNTTMESLLLAWNKPKVFLVFFKSVFSSMLTFLIETAYENN